MGDYLSRDELDALCLEAENRERVPARHFHKDYWVTHVLRALTEQMPGLLLFKGGTSLSKAYGLIQRFSEDVDLLVLADPDDAAAVDGLLDQVRDYAAASLARAGAVTKETREAGLGAIVELTFDPPKQMAKVRGMSRSIRLEPGVRGGPTPSETRTIEPMLARAVPGAAAAAGMASFEIEVLHPARTLVEKLFAVHSIGMRLLEDPERTVASREARHFYDIHQLLDTGSPALTYLQNQTGILAEVVADCEAISARWYPGADQARPASFADSPAFVEPSLASRLEPAYDGACAALCYPNAEPPSWGAVCALVGQHRSLLSAA